MVAKAARQDQAFLIDLAALQEKHIETAKLLLGDGPALNKFVARLLDDIGNLKAMLHAISIGAPLSQTRDCPPFDNCCMSMALPEYACRCCLSSSKQNAQPARGRPRKRTCKQIN